MDLTDLGSRTRSYPRFGRWNITDNIGRQRTTGKGERPMAWG
jgi:hypothetical protein